MKYITKKWTPERIEKLKEVYLKIEDWNLLLKEFPFSTKRSIQSTASKLGLKKPRISNAWFSHKKDMFDTWTEESAYLLGYLEADGYIKTNDRALLVQFKCSKKDVAFLEQLKKITKYTGKISLLQHIVKGKKYQSAGFTITSRRWIDSLLPRHFRKEKIPSIPEELIHHYIRGYFDGDGSIYFSKQIQDYKSSFVFNSLELAHSFRTKILRQNIKVSNVHKKTSSDKCWYFCLSNKQTFLLREFMYQGSSLYMIRKYQLFQRQHELHNS